MIQSHVSLITFPLVEGAQKEFLIPNLNVDDSKGNGPTKKKIIKGLKHPKINCGL